MSKVPTKLKVVLRQKIGYCSDYTDEKHKCRPAFVTDADSPKTLETAKAWAAGRRWRRGNGKTPDPEVVEIDNLPTKGFKVIDLEERGEGGRAFKVITPQGWLVDMREDTFMPAVLKRGLAKNGTIPGVFLWVRLGSQMRLVEVHSDLHKRVLKEQAERNAKVKAPKLKTKDLVVGGVYGGSVAGTNVYVGRVRHKGKLKLAWVNLVWHEPREGETTEHWQDLLEASLALTREQRHWKGHSYPGGRHGRYITETVPRTPQVNVTGSHSYTKLHGRVQVDLDALKALGVQFFDGWGTGLEQAEWA
jgi:hypothetical protein